MRATRRGAGALWAEVALAVVALVALCAVVLPITPEAAEPDDGAYHASIVALTEGHFLTLSTAQAVHVAASLGDNPTAPPNQWVQLGNGRWISEKDPGYPFLAALFQEFGLIRWAPLFFGALACLGLFVGARRWLGRFGGSAAVGLYCSSGAALAFAWRDYMPTFTDASLVAAGSGFLLWAVLASDARLRRRAWVGLAGFLALELATFVRYTNVVVLGCAVVAVLVLGRQRAVGLPRRVLCWWLASAALFAVGLAVFNDLVYGGPLRSGYPPGEVTFSLGAIGPNIRLVPAHLMQAMPMLVLALIALAWIVLRRLRLARSTPGGEARRDLWVALSLAASWFAIWGLYATYTWTTDPTNGSVSDVRFYVPALGPIALLGAWLVTRLRRAWLAGATSTAVVTVLFGLGVWAFYAMYAAVEVPLHR